MTGTRSKVCVGIMTFNQANYIRQALDSALAQKTDFPVEILVHDDCSTDGTREIVETYRDAHPDRIHAILQEQNQVSQGKRVLALMLPSLCREYVAMLDGDDFWRDERKLQVQADFLDTHPDCALCQTQTFYFNERKGRVEGRFPSPVHRRQKLTCSDLATGNFVQTSALMFRAAAVPEIPRAFHALPYGDYAFVAMLAQSGWIGYIDEPMTMYRIHSSNWWVNRPPQEQLEATRKVLYFLATHLDPDLRAPWVAAANARLRQSRPGVLTRARAMCRRPTARLRRALGMEPK